MSQLFDPASTDTAEQAVDFLSRWFQASTEYAIIGLGLDGTILLWNEGARRLYGFEPEEMVGRANAASLQDPAAPLQPLLQTALQQGQWVGTLAQRRQSGQLFKARVTLTPAYDAASRPSGFLLLAQDMAAKSDLAQELLETRLAEYQRAEATGLSSVDDEKLAYWQAMIYAQELKAEIIERHRVEAALRYQAALVDNVSDAIIATDSLLNITVWNNAAEKIYGWLAAEVLGQPIRQIIPAEFPGTTAEAVRQKLDEQGHWHGELIQQRKDGTRVYALASTSRLKNEAGELIGAVTVNHDLTEHKQAEEDLRRHAARNEALLKNSEVLVEARLDVQTALETIARQTALTIGDACVITRLSDDEHRFEAMAFDHADPAIAAAMAPLFAAVPDPATVRWLQPMLRTGQPLVVPVISSEQARQTISPPYWSYLEQVGVHSLLIVPLQVQGRVIGTLGVSRTRPGQPYTAADQVFLQELAGRAALTIQNADLFEHLRQANERLQALSLRLLEVQESERRYLARELHDEVGQLLTGLKFKLEMSARAPSPSALAEIQTLVNDLMGRVRNLSLDLRPSMLDDLGLLPVMLWHFERYTAQTGVEVMFRHSGLEDQRFPSPVETTVYRLVQEALTNVARHAGVSQVRVDLWADPDMFHLQVKDEGRGFAAETVLAASSSVGLRGMQERVALLGGWLVVEASSGSGACLTVELPLAKEAL